MKKIRRSKIKHSRSSPVQDSPRCQAKDDQARLSSAKLDKPHIRPPSKDDNWVMSIPIPAGAIDRGGKSAAAVADSTSTLKQDNEPTSTLETTESGAVVVVTPAPILAACRKAIIKSPSKARATLEKYQHCIDSTLKLNLEIVGSYDYKVALAGML